MEWVEKKSSELYVSSSGLSKSSDQFGYGYPFLSYKDVFNNYYAPDKLSTLVNSTEKDRMKCSVKQGDVFLTRTSETTDELGMSCVALHDYVNATFNGFTKRLRPLTDEIEPKYAAYYFRSPYFRSQCISLASLITRASLNDGMIRRLKIRYPLNRKVQEKIGEILYTYDSLIGNNTKRIRLLEKMAENLYKEWFSYGKIIKGGTIVRLTDIIQITRGLSYSTAEIDCEEGLDLINLKNIQAYGGFRYDGTKKFCGKYKNEQIVCEGDLVMGVTDMTQDRRTVGSVALIPKTDKLSVISADLIKISSSISSVFLFGMFKYGNVSKYVAQFANGANVLHLRPKALHNIKVLLPNPNLINKYVDIVSPMVAEMNKLYVLSEKLARQRDLLLPRLMSGKLEVKEELLE